MYRTHKKDESFFIPAKPETHKLVRGFWIYAPATRIGINEPDYSRHFEDWPIEPDDYPEDFTLMPVEES